MIPNIWQIDYSLDDIYCFKTNKSRHELSDEFSKKNINGWVYTKNKVYILCDHNKAQKQFGSTKSTDIYNLNKKIKNSLLYQFIDSKILKKGFTRIKKRTFFLKKSNDRSQFYQHVNHIGCFLNFAFKYTIEEINGKEYFVLDPARIITKDGETYDPKYANDVNEKLFSSSKNIFDYGQRIDVIGKFTKIFGKSFSLNSESQNNIEFNLSRNSDSTVKSFKEPEIEFGSGKKTNWPQLGINRYGPLDYNETFLNRPEEIKIVLIGTDSAFHLLKQLNEGLTEGKYPFRGFSSVYKSNLKMNNSRFISLQEAEINAVSNQEDISQLFLKKVQKLKNNSIKFDICLLEIQPVWENLKYSEGTNLHDRLKVLFSKEKVHTQLITRNSEENIQDETLNNLALGIYFKAGGNPWRLDTEYKNVAYIGISFGYLKKEKKQLIGIAEIFDTYGQFVSLRSMTIKKIPLNEHFISKRDYHLSQKQFSLLIHQLLEDYQSSVDNTLPENLIIHKTTYFNTEESNIVSELQDYPIKISLAHIQSSHFFHLITSDGKEPTRGTMWKIDDKRALLYTTGILSGQSYYLGIGAPLPLLVNLEWSDEYSMEDICKQILELTKLNFNSTNSYSKEPSTLLHSRKIVDLLRAGLEEKDIPEDPRYYL